MRSRSRRQFVQGMGVLGFAVWTGCGLRLPGSQPSGVRRIGYVASVPPNPDTWSSFQQGMRDLGYVLGENLVIDYHYASANVPMVEAAAELVRRQPEVIVVPASTDARTARAATTVIPIVSAGNGDLVTSGLADSQGRPGGNVTGLSTPLLASKQLQLLQETVPTLSRVAVLFDTFTFDLSRSREAYDVAARALGLQLQFVGAGNAGDLEPAFEAAVREHADGLFVLLGPLLSAELAITRIAELAFERQLPSMWQNTEGARRGGLLGYGPNRVDLSRRAAIYVDKILQGARPGDLPVEHPTTFEVVVNLKTAPALGLTISKSIIDQATEIIQ